MKRLTLLAIIVIIPVINALLPIHFVWDALITQFQKELLIQQTIHAHAIQDTSPSMIQQLIAQYVIIPALLAHSLQNNAYLVMQMF